MHIIYVTSDFIQASLEDKVLISAPAGVKLKTNDKNKYITWEITDSEVINQINTFLKQFVPCKITARQARLQLIKEGVYEAVEKFINEGDNSVAKVEWEYALDIERTNPLVGVLANQFNWDDEKLDDMFIKASVL
ncbi:hypothetical protein [Campylobacter mucosalis]|uniref:Uncharacterized protein n=1 Tax=Campylobacter mucosalis CCUG 21559 TaxID=1032067 RepID=A0A6G5QGD4_9BACT|nr:hypothetical protein [Campylobacter mucosalis]QCD44122.1 hypothetical protein CMUC_0308 [Campylobacter mucosalis CCUG 21559]QCD44711.1 hypothetical protein CMUC_0922 [Campylobacter mucosalis CCUG 21559]